MMNLEINFWRKLFMAATFSILMASQAIAEPFLGLQKVLKISAEKWLELTKLGTPFQQQEFSILLQNQTLLSYGFSLSGYSSAVSALGAGSVLSAKDIARQTLLVAKDLLNSPELLHNSVEEFRVQSLIYDLNSFLNGIPSAVQSQWTSIRTGLPNGALNGTTDPYLPVGDNMYASRWGLIFISELTGQWKLMSWNQVQNQIIQFNLFGVKPDFLSENGSTLTEAQRAVAAAGYSYGLQNSTVSPTTRPSILLSSMGTCLSGCQILGSSVILIPKGAVGSVGEIFSPGLPNPKQPTQMVEN